MKLLDIGALNGDSALHFIVFPGIHAIDAYEPNPDFIDLWDAISKFYPDITFFQSAVSDYNGTAEYTKRPPDIPLGSTISPDKRHYGEGEMLEVQCLDIADLVTEECWLKLDVEGEEYRILERLLDTNKIRLVKRLYLEWHTNKMTGDYQSREDAIIKRLQEAGVETVEW